MELVLFWKSSVNLIVEDTSKYYIDAFINKDTDEEWKFIGFYDKPETCRRHEAWAKLQRLNSHPNVRWLCVGDFKENLK